MPEYRFFPSTNPYSSLQTQGGGNKRRRRDGWCAAASAIWCANILVKEKKPGDSDPDKGLAGILQVRYRWDPQGGGQDFLNLLSNVGLSGDYTDGLYRDGALHRMIREPGVYHFSNDTHSMAADTRDGHMYWYDIETGLFAYGSDEEWKRGISSRYPSEGRDWCIIECTV